jgi:hypothetical protein
VARAGSSDYHNGSIRTHPFFVETAAEEEICPAGKKEPGKIRC